MKRFELIHAGKANFLRSPDPFWLLLLEGVHHDSNRMSGRATASTYDPSAMGGQVQVIMGGQLQRPSGIRLTRCLAQTKRPGVCFARSSEASSSCVGFCSGPPMAPKRAHSQPLCRQRFLPRRRPLRMRSPIEQHAPFLRVTEPYNSNAN